MKIGQSIDIHQLVNGHPLVLGGVEIPFHLGLLGHSDADALVHAIAEAIIGALGLGDLGRHFPDNDEAYKNIASLEILGNVYQMMVERKQRIGNVDALIIIEKPKIAPYLAAMQENIARVLHCEAALINIKATTGETLGFVGNSQGVVASAVVLLKGEEDD